MARVIYVRIDPDQHAGVIQAAHAARTSLQDFCLQAILDASQRWNPQQPPAAHAALDLGEGAEFDTAREVA
jgi:hypothetical protein